MEPDMTETSSAPPQNPAAASRAAFKEARPEIQELLKRILQEEREVMHMRRRAEIHAKLLEHIKRAIP